MNLSEPPIPSVGSPTMPDAGIDTIPALRLRLRALEEAQRTLKESLRIAMDLEFSNVSRTEALWALVRAMLATHPEPQRLADALQAEAQTTAERLPPQCAGFFERDVQQLLSVARGPTGAAPEADASPAP